jgi:hypothetical protein
MASEVGKLKQISNTMKDVKLLRVVLFIVGLMLGGMTFAQVRPVAQDRVYLRSGDVYTGIIVEQIPGESIRLWRSMEADTLQFTMESIARITKAMTEPESTNPDSLKTEFEKPQPQFNLSPWKISFQFGAGGGDYPVAILGAGVYKYFPVQRAWLGINAAWLGDQSSRGASSVPVLLHGSIELANSMKGRLATGVFAEAGYSFNLADAFFDEKTQSVLKHGDGMHTNIGVRFRLNVMQNVGIWLDVGYTRHTSTLRNSVTDMKAGVKDWNLAVFRGSVFF